MSLCAPGLPAAFEITFDARLVFCFVLRLPARDSTALRHLRRFHRMVQEQAQAATLHNHVVASRRQGFFVACVASLRFSAHDRPAVSSSGSQSGEKRRQTPLLNSFRLSLCKAVAASPSISFFGSRVVDLPLQVLCQAAPSPGPSNAGSP